MNRVSVTIDGIEYKITGEKSEAEIVKVAKFIDTELKNISAAAPSLSKVSAAILTSVNIADQLFDSRDEVDELKHKIAVMQLNEENKSEDLEKEFDNVLSKLDESDQKIAELNSNIEKLEKDLAKKDEKIKKLQSEGNTEKTDSKDEGDKDKVIKSLEMKIKEMEHKVAVAESMANEFQNKAYNIQLNYEKLKNEKK